MNNQKWFYKLIADYLCISSELIISVQPKLTGKIIHERGFYNDIKYIVMHWNEKGMPEEKETSQLELLGFMYKNIID